jgi:dinuclear metal center YbgI/SA1388 family protein
MVQAQDILTLLDRLAPPSLAESWDNVGLMVGALQTETPKVALALDPTPETIRSAYQAGARVLVTHHPLIFRPLTRLDLADPTASAAALALELNVTVLAAHTNLDQAPDGVSWVLARALELESIEVLDPAAPNDHSKLVVFVPIGYERQVREALFQAGAGRIGAYSGCSFSGRGEGTFLPSEEARPFLGRAGRVERAAESRLEVLVENRLLPGAVKAMIKAHPYEEAAYNVYSLSSRPGPTGTGCFGMLKKQVNFINFVDIVQTKLEIKRVRVGSRPPETVTCVAVVGGSGGGYVARAHSRGAQVLVSGDLGYHQAREAEALGLGLIDAGHFATERPAVRDLARRLAGLAEAAGMPVVFEVLDREEDPWRVVEGAP